MATLAFTYWCFKTYSTVLRGPRGGTSQVIRVPTGSALFFRARSLQGMSSLPRAKTNLVKTTLLSAENSGRASPKPASRPPSRNSIGQEEITKRVTNMARKDIIMPKHRGSLPLAFVPVASPRPSPTVSPRASPRPSPSVSPVGSRKTALRRLLSPTMDTKKNESSRSSSSLSNDSVEIYQSLTSIHHSHLKDYVNKLDDTDGFQNEFIWICEQEQMLSTDQTSAKDPQNKDKNRYSNILPLEHSRVKLENAKNDYINASYIHGYNKKNQFIAAQGPLANTANDFWEMVWEQNSISVVMTTKLVENGRLKCDQYWPNVENSKQYGDIRVETIEEIDSDCGSFLERTMTLTKKACKPNAKESPKRPCALSSPKPNSMQKADTTPRDCKTKSPSNTSQATSPKVKVFHENSLTTSPKVKAFRGRAVTKSVSEESLERSSDEMPVDDEKEETRTIVQYYYKAWPDHGVPSSPNGVIEMLGAINERQEAQAGAGPIVVHCSAGVGRTGTMVAIDTAIKAVLDPKNGFVDFPRVILDLRRQRQMMVQSLSQYAFCYYALDEFVEKDMPDNVDERENNSA